jgi:diguanylate cyclase (GGDEF)-like protein
VCDQLAGVVHLAALNRKISEASEELEATNRRLSEMNRALVELSTVDALTGLANRRQFDRQLDLEWRRSIRSALPLSLLLIDVDDFKAYNDNYGHLRGDAVLAEVAKTLGASFARAGDVVARYGGEEFAALLPNTTAEGALELAEQARARVEARAVPHRGSRRGRFLTVSAGVGSVMPESRLSHSLLVEAADRALYRAKAAGRNCVRVGPDSEDETAGS